VRAIADSYLPAADDYDYEDQAGYRAGQDQSLPGYGGEGSGQEEGSGEEEEEVTESYETTTTVDYPDYDSRAAGDQYGAPSSLDNSYAAPPGGDYGAPGEESVVDVARAESDYAAPSTDYAVPDAENSRQNGFPFAAVESRTGAAPGGGGERQCPGGAIEACVAVCPGSSVRVYGACVGGCADRCPEA